MNPYSLGGPKSDRSDSSGWPTISTYTEADPTRVAADRQPSVSEARSKLKSYTCSFYDIQRLRFSYGAHLVLREVSVRIHPGEFVALIGPNGAGKSTLLKVIAGIEKGYRGSVAFLGRPLSAYRPMQLAREVAFVPQETRVAFPFRVEEIIMMGRMPHRSGSVFDSRQDWAYVESVMQLTATSELTGKTFNELSGGEKQRVVLASALAQDPKVLLLDEPTVHLDLRHQIHFYEILEQLNAEQGMTIISVTHDINLAARYAKRMIAVQLGALITDGQPETVMTSQRIQEIFGISATVIERPDGRGKYIIAGH